MKLSMVCFKYYALYQFLSSCWKNGFKNHYSNQVGKVLCLKWRNQRGLESQHCQRNKATDLTWKQNNDCLLIRPCLSLDTDIGRSGQVVLLLTVLHNSSFWPTTVLRRTFL